MMIPHSRIGAGITFGDIALQNNKRRDFSKPVTRAATITCVEDSWFATLTKAGYQEILLKLDEPQKSLLISFFHSC